MSDNLRRYRAIRQALKQCYPGEPKGNMARHLNTLAALISGIRRLAPSAFLLVRGTRHTDDITG